MTSWDTKRCDFQICQKPATHGLYGEGNAFVTVKRDVLVTEWLKKSAEGSLDGARKNNNPETPGDVPEGKRTSSQFGQSSILSILDIDDDSEPDFRMPATMTLHAKSSTKYGTFNVGRGQP